ncbi:Nucleolar and coiled-body phosphoprotein [Thalictrum thalictroides]|uniref:Nucleolar and coiled-body phosphoprotein n=1 Tax=Thalictrum thalictroides TaxID=46969 RepID=A0A7J6X0D5_THATH|nr:Nucleolar and coiled-body phosphoprotein [Thalictrum thalictroides]
MLQTLSEKTTKAAASSSPFAFVPRQVTLANNNMGSSKTLEIGNKTPTIVEPSIKKEKSKKKKKNISKDPNLLSIAAYLQHKGLTNTLAALQSEASIDELDYSEVHALDWETKHVESSKCDAKSNNKDLEKLDKEGQEESKCAAAVESSIKKKKSKESNASTVDSQPGDSNDITKCLNDSDDKSKSQLKKKNSKPGSEPLDGSLEAILAPTEETAPESQLDKPDKKSKEKKKKLISVENGGSEVCSLEGKLASEKSFDFKKENVSTLDDNSVGDKKSSKKRKRMPSEGNDIQPDDAVKPTIEIFEVMGKKDRVVESDGHTVDNKLNILAEGEKTPKGNDNQTKADLHGVGYLEKSGREGSAMQKSMKKQQNGSAEPKTVNAFQRVKIDEVEFADDRLQDNSYWAKDGADIGYGAKAQEVLGQVRGRDFRHEKTKKKRGSYRGGQIDLQTHSIKFNYSDEE